MFAVQNIETGDFYSESPTLKTEVKHAGMLWNNTSILPCFARPYTRYKDVATIFKWEDGKTPVPFVCFELLRVISETVRFKMSHPGWDGWFIDYNGVLHSSDIGGKGWTPEQLVWSTATRSEAALLRNDVKKLQAQLDAAIAENTALREMFLDNCVTDEVASMQEKINALMARINTARVIPFAPADIERQPLEKAA